MRLLIAALSVIAAAAMPAGAQDMRNPEPQKKLVQTRDRINKVLDAQIERLRDVQIRSKCKAEAEKQYWAIRFNKRRMYADDCVAQARTIVVDRSGSIP